MARRITFEALQNDGEALGGSQPTGISAGFPCAKPTSEKSRAARSKRFSRQETNASHAGKRQSNAGRRLSRQQTQRQNTQPLSGQSATSFACPGQDPTNAKKLRNKIASAYGEFLEVAICRLRAASANQEYPEESLRHHELRNLQHAWPHMLIPPMLWIPFSFCFTCHTKFVLINARDKKNKRKLRSLVTMNFGVGRAMVRGSLKVHDEVPEQVQAEDNNAKRDKRDEVVVESVSSAKLRESFHVAVSEAKLAQVQSLAAARDVQSLRMALDRAKRSHHQSTDVLDLFGKSPRPPPRGAGGAKALAAALGEPQLRAQLLGQREHMRQLEASLRQELQDVAGQTQRLRAELHRRQGRASTAPSAVTAPSTAISADWGWSRDTLGIPTDVPLAIGALSSRGGGEKEHQRTAAKYLSSSRVLPDISSCPPTPRQALPATCPVLSPRARPESRDPRMKLYAAPWRAGTAP